MTHWKKLTNPDYLGAYSLENRQDIVLTIGKVQQETVTGPEGKRRIAWSAIGRSGKSR